MLVSLQQLVRQAQTGGFALGAFNTQNLETTLGIIRAAVDAHSPVVIQVSETTIEYAGIKPITHIVETIAKNAAVDVPVALHLDHGKKFWSIAECIHAGFSSIMMSASDLPFDENIALTKQAADYAHARGVWAQGELGRVRASDDYLATVHREEYLTDPVQAKEFVKATGIDTLAVAVGNVWGVHKLSKGTPPLDEDRLKAIHKATPSVPLVLHGASGLPREQIDLARRYGVSIINIDTELRWVFTKRLRATLDEDKNRFDPREVLEPSINAVRDLVAEKLAMFGSAGKA
ncbi:MAG: class II fructose-bisphosphate aldolase [Candidatus Kerfeldbacteria bacterium]|nr:class II fructose-bisphosphate aldolase [Candidatus Kerfeldbacteria bacterium]